MSADREPIKAITTPVRLEYDFTAGQAATLFLRGLEKKKIVGARTGPGQPVLVPPRGADPRTSELAQEAVEVSDKGTVVTYSVIRVPSENIKFDLPYVCVNVLLDGADAPLLHAVDAGSEAKLAVGTRVVPRWANEPSGGINDVVCFDLEKR